MIVSLSSLFVNPLPAAQSPAVGGRSSGSGFLDLAVQKSTAYKAPGATIARLPATWVSPEIDLMKALAATVALQAAAGMVLASASKYTSSGVR